MSWNPFDSEKLSEMMKNSWYQRGSMDFTVVDRDGSGNPDNSGGGLPENADPSSSLPPMQNIKGV